MSSSFFSGKHMNLIKPKNKIFGMRALEIRDYCKIRRPLLYLLCPTPPQYKMQNTKGLNIKVLHAKKQARKIAEAIILQSIEDLWSPAHKKESIEFFTGEGFILCAKIAGMGLYEKLKLIQVIKKAI